MKVKLILPSLTEAKSVFWRPVKYPLYPPLTLAAYLDSNDEIEISNPTKIEIKSNENRMS